MRAVVKFMIGAALIVTPAAAIAGWKAVPAGTPVLVAKSKLLVTPTPEWNRWSARPSKKGEIWTMDGLALNELTFLGGIAPGEPLLKERNKKDEPFPKFNANMLAPDIVAMFEGTMRILLKTSLFTIDNVEPTTFAGKPGVRFNYTFAVQGDELRRKGEARASIVDGKLYLINFQAPAIHYYDAGIESARKVMESARF